jgi:hypothetical protein
VSWLHGCPVPARDTPFHIARIRRKAFQIIVNKGFVGISLLLTQGTEQLVGSFLIPANGVAMDLSGDDGRSFDSVDASGTSLFTFFPDLFLSRVSNDIVTAISPVDAS